MAKKFMEDLVFNQMLCTEGYKVDYAVGTTYSLDLTTFISLPFSLGFLEEPDEVMKASPAYLFQAIKLCTDRLAVFCNYSDMKVPQGTKHVYYSLLENSIFGVNADKKKNGIVNFHPKVWVVQEHEINGDRQQIKVIVMSRNLTGDNSLDIVCELVGEIEGKEASQKSQLKHKPLCDFLHYLSKYANKEKRRMIERLIASINCVKKFDLIDSPFDDYDFVPMGIRGYNGEDCLAEMEDPYETVIVSPFIDDNTILKFKDAKNKTLITREYSITPKILEAFGKDNIFIVNQGMIDNEENEVVDLHAKVYYIKSRGNYSQHVFLGSANATKNGFGRNVEFLLKLRYAPYQGSYNIFRENFVIKDDKDCKFIPMIGLVNPASDPTAEYQATLRLRRIITSIVSADVRLNTLGTYDVTITLNDDFVEEGATIYPLMNPDKIAVLSNRMVFEGMKIENLSEFYVIEVAGLKKMIKISTTGIPVDRDEAICRKIMNKNQFLDCISFLLSDNKKMYLAGKPVNDEPKLAAEANINTSPFILPALYENLLRSAYERPEVMDDIRTFVASFPKDMVPTEFEELYKAVLNGLKSVKR